MPDTSRLTDIEADPSAAAQEPQALQDTGAPVLPPGMPPSSFHLDLRSLRRDPEAIRHTFETGAYPYKTRLSNRLYMQQIAELQVELLKADTKDH